MVNVILLSQALDTYMIDDAARSRGITHGFLGKLFMVEAADLSGQLQLFGAFVDAQLT